MSEQAIIAIISLAGAFIVQAVILVWQAARFVSRQDRVEEILQDMVMVERVDHEEFKKSFAEINRKLDNHELRLQHIEEER
jgi:hypothetical protein